MPKKIILSSLRTFNPSLVVTSICSFGISLLFTYDILINRTREQQFVYLAESFLQSKLYFLHVVENGYDATLFNGKYYWPEGPFPAVLLMPFVLIFGPLPLQGFIAFGLNILNLLLLYKLALKITNNKEVSTWLSLGYIFATAYLKVALDPNYSYFSQIVASSLLLLGIYEFFNTKRWLLIGIFIGLAGATRFDLFAASLFFFLIIALAKSSFKIKVKQLFFLNLPIFLSLILLFLYNFLRFGSFFDQGYLSETINPALAANRAAGLWSFIHFPANFYYLFLKGPEEILVPNSHILAPPYFYANPWGLSIFLTSPIFLWIFKNNFSSLVTKSAAVTILIILFLLLGYCGIGYTQIGYRYALDFYPFLFVLLCFALLKGISIKLKVVVVLSFIFNFYLILFSGF